MLIVMNIKRDAGSGRHWKWLAVSPSPRIRPCFPVYIIIIA